MLYAETKYHSQLSVYYQKFDSEKIISQVVEISEDCDQNGDGCLIAIKVAIFVVWD